MANVQKIIPVSFAEISVEQILHRYNRSPKIIYLSVLIMIVIGFTSLFYIKVDVSVRAQGILKVPGERIYPKATGSGYVHYINPLLKENAQVTAGDTLIVIGNPIVDEQMQYVMGRMAELDALLADLALLTNLHHNGISDGVDENMVFQTSVYKQNYQLFCRRYQNGLQHFGMIRKNHEREELLHRQQLTAPADFELAQHEYDRAISDLSTLYHEQMSQWRQDQKRFGDELTELQSRTVQMTLQKQELTIVASVSGSIQQLSGLSVGNYIAEGEIFMEISPEGNLYAECYVTPHDIGLIQIGQKATIQVDAFNYNQWGMLSAHVTEIAHDVIFFDGIQPFYKVLCITHEKHLSLKNGYTGSLKKGMTFSVRFKVTQRTLSQWLFDKMDNWLNPNNPA
ncbi:MAG: HlyD family secretion protein [Bacteroidales bacterium]|nr:HlyD family secretion protein [Bacteroidales bacterium]